MKALAILVCLGTLVSCRSRGSNAADPGGTPAPPTPATPNEVAPSRKSKEPQPALPMIGKAVVTHFRVLDVKKFKQIGAKGGVKGSNPDFYAVKGKLVKHSGMLKESARGATACFSYVKGREVRKGEVLEITSTLSKRGDGDSKDFFFSNIANSTQPEKGIVVICMKRSEITAHGFIDALTGIVEIVKKQK